ncbi:hypothetical protein UVI_02035050 [Ustilaginoidea virens]|uniref:Trafficking protein particle complex II-specific subunit 65 IgD3 domain-containing protein n=1 Tax=Ustilaginoidea virens TaxID=1159556 RepID=A0A1B5KSX7_USTVR|nr:hypothetical protein UVI_02035050 [Ustilaginoidea virens]
METLEKNPDGLANDLGHEFIEQSYLSYVVPARTNTHLNEAFKDAEASNIVRGSIQQRESLFFVVCLEARVLNSRSSDRDSQPAAETIFKGHVEDISSPLTIVDEENLSEQHGSCQAVYAVWKLSVLLNRPRMRLNSPLIAFSAAASLKPHTAGDARPRGTEYLQSGMPSSLNLLESFSSDQALDGVRPRLSALRVSRVAPVSRQQDLVVHLRALPLLQMPIFPAIHTRIRFSRPQTAPSKAALIAVLEVDLTSHVECEVLLDDIKLSTNDGTVESLHDDVDQMKLPMSCVAHDHIIFLYHIKPTPSEKPSKSVTGTLDISLTAVAQVSPGVCAPRLSMRWDSVLDFTAPVNPSFSTTAESSGIQRAHKPSQLSIGSNTAVVPLKTMPVLRPDALPGLESSTARTEAAVPDLGITMSFTGPSAPVRRGDVFSWEVNVVNRASEATARPPRKLALVAVPKRRRNDTRPAQPPSTASRRRGEPDVAGAVMDANILHALQRDSAFDATEVVCLSADTRVGPLAPGTCHVVELQFLALKEGIVGVEAVRVVDLGSQEHVDIRDLPTTIVEPAVVA